jgi:hypothetical protein
MAKRVAVMIVLLLMVSSFSFGLSDACKAFDCSDPYGTGHESCWEYLSGGGNLQGCTTVRQCDGAHNCITFCRYSSCYYV